MPGRVYWIRLAGSSAIREPFLEAMVAMGMMPFDLLIDLSIYIYININIYIYYIIFTYIYIIYISAKVGQSSKWDNG